MDIENNKRKRTEDNHDDASSEGKRFKREMPALEMLNYLNASVQEGMLYEAIKKNDLSMVQFLVENSSVSFDTISSEKYLLNEIVQGKNAEKFYPLMAAILVNSYEITEYLLMKKFQTVYNNYDDTPFNAILTASITSGDCNLLQLVIDYEKDLLLQWPEDLPLPIIAASLWNNANKINLLKDNGVDINALCPMLKKTALHAAAERNACDSVKILIKLGANINIFNNDNYTPLSLAVKSKSFNVVKELLGNGADLFITDTDKNKNAVLQALTHDTDVAKDLLQLLALESNFGKNRIKEAAQQGNFDISVIPENVMNRLEFKRTEMLANKATYYLLKMLLTDERTKEIAEGILEGMQGQNLDLFKPIEEQEKILKENKEFIAGMKILSNVPDEPRRIILSFLYPENAITHNASESRKVAEIAEVMFSCRFAKK